MNEEETRTVEPSSQPSDPTLSKSTPVRPRQKSRLITTNRLTADPDALPSPSATGYKWTDWSTIQFCRRR